MITIRGAIWRPGTLHACGCRHMVCIRGPQAIFSARARFEGLPGLLPANGLAVQTVDCDYDFDAGLAMTEELFEKVSQRRRDFCQQ